MASMILGYGAALAGIVVGIANSYIPEMVTFLSFAVAFFAILGFLVNASTLRTSNFSFES